MDNVIDYRDRVLLEEAQWCETAGAFRAAFIVTWIAVAEGLRWRFNEMSHRDGQMSKWMQETDRAEQNGETIDQRLLDRAKSSGLVTEPEYKKLTYLKDMRNSFAHPTGAAPTAAEVSAAIQVAVDVVLSRPPLLGHGFARELADTHFQDPHYLDDVEDKVVTYVDQLYPLLHPDVPPWLAEQAITRLDAILPDPQLGIFARRATWFTRRLLTIANVDSSSKWPLDKMLNSHPVAASFVAGDVRVFQRIGPQSGDRVFGWLAESASAGQILPPSIAALTLLVSLDDAELLNERQRQRLIEAIDRMPYSSLQQGAPFRIWARKVVDALSIHDWYTQNPAALALGSIGPTSIEQSDDAVLESLGRAVLAAADGTAKEAEALISRLRNNDGADWPAPFIKGLLLETVLNEDGTFRLKRTLLPAVADILAQHPVGVQIISDVIGAINEAAPNNRRFALRNGLDQLNFTIQNGADQDAIRALADALRALTPDDGDIDDPFG